MVAYKLSSMVTAPFLGPMKEFPFISIVMFLTIFAD